MLLVTAVTGCPVRDGGGAGALVWLHFEAPTEAARTPHAQYPVTRVSLDLDLDYRALAGAS